MWIQLILITIFFILFLNSRFNFKKTIRNIIKFYQLPEVEWTCPLVGPAWRAAFIKHEDILDEFAPYFAKFDIGKFWLLGHRFVGVQSPEDLEAIMGSTTHINKGVHYKSVMEWLQEGLLTSSGEKWHLRRKLLTPAFHFKILEDSLPIINQNAKRLTEKFLETKGKPFDVGNYLTLCTLDVICETAMSIKLRSQDNQAVDYVADIKRLCQLIAIKELKFFSNTLFYMSPWGWEFSRVLNRLHSFTEKVIHKRKEELEKEMKKNPNYLTEKKRKAFLDCMIDVELKNPGTFSHLDMREEVDTFMFEGHDTTSVALLFSIFMLGLHKDVQERASNEQKEIFEYSDRPATTKDLQEMHYLEMVIKETLRLFPSVPYIARLLKEDLVLKGPATKGLVIPEGTNLFIVPFFIHRNSKTFPDPLKFDPERFSEEQSIGRHPYSYFPFSAGPRNCIGQRFAMMELKVVLSTILRRCNIESLTKRDDKFTPLLILRPHKTIMIKCTPREEETVK